MEQQWTDEKIVAEVDDLQLDENGSDYLEANEKVRRLMRRMRDDYEQRIAELEASLAVIGRNHRALLHLLQSAVETYTGEDGKQ